MNCLGTLTLRTQSSLNRQIGDRSVDTQCVRGLPTCCDSSIRRDMNGTSAIAPPAFAKIYPVGIGTRCRDVSANGDPLNISFNPDAVGADTSGRDAVAGFADLHVALARPLQKNTMRTSACGCDGAGVEDDGIFTIDNMYAVGTITGRGDRTDIVYSGIATLHPYAGRVIALCADLGVVQIVYSCIDTYYRDAARIPACCSDCGGVQIIDRCIVTNYQDATRTACAGLNRCIVLIHNRKTEAFQKHTMA